MHSLLPKCNYSLVIVFWFCANSQGCFWKLNNAQYINIHTNSECVLINTTCKTEENLHTAKWVDFLEHIHFYSWIQLSMCCWYSRWPATKYLQSCVVLGLSIAEAIYLAHVEHSNKKAIRISDEHWIMFNPSRAHEELTCTC